MSHGAAGLLSTIPVLCMGIFAPPAAYLAARVGAARAVTVSLLLIGGFGLLRAGAPGAALLILLTVPIGIGMGMGNALMPVAVKERFSRTTRCARRRSTPSASSSARRPRRRSPSRSPTSGRATAAGASRSRVFSIASLRLPRRLAARAAPGRRAGAPPPARRRVPRLPWRSTGAWWLCAIFLLITILFYGIGAWLPDVLVEDGWSESSAGATLAVLNATHGRRDDSRRHRSAPARARGAR